MPLAGLLAHKLRSSAAGILTDVVDITRFLSRAHFASVIGTALIDASSASTSTPALTGRGPGILFNASRRPARITVSVRSDP
jgi:hypothetical protein